MKLDFSQKILKNINNIKFHEKPAIGSRVVPCRLTDRQTGITEAQVDLRNFANSPKNHWKYSVLSFKAKCVDQRKRPVGPMA